MRRVCSGSSIRSSVRSNPAELAVPQASVGRTSWRADSSEFRGEAGAPPLGRKVAHRPVLNEPQGVAAIGALRFGAAASRTCRRWCRRTNVAGVGMVPAGWSRRGILVLSRRSGCDHSGRDGRGRGNVSATFDNNHRPQWTRRGATPDLDSWRHPGSRTQLRPRACLARWDASRRPPRFGGSGRARLRWRCVPRRTSSQQPVLCHADSCGCPLLLSVVAPSCASPEVPPRHPDSLRVQR